MTHPATWIKAFDHDLSEVADGDDFLHLDKIGANKVKEHKLRCTVGNVLAFHGGEKASKKKEPEEYKKEQVRIRTNVLEFAAGLTENNIYDVAMPISVSTVRNYDIVGKKFQLPPYTATGENTLLGHFFDQVAQNYAIYLKGDEEMYYSKGGTVGGYTKKTSWPDKLRPILSETVRYYCKWWHLHPWQSREEAHEAATVHMAANILSRGGLKEVITNVLTPKKDAILKHMILNLETIDNPHPAVDDPADQQVLKDNEEGRALIIDFLKHRKYKLENLDPVLDMKNFIEATKDKMSDEEFAEFTEKFDLLVPLKNKVYLAKLEAHEKKLDNEEKKRKAKEDKEKEKAEKKQKLAEEAAKAMEEKAAKEQEEREASQSLLDMGGNKDTETEDITDGNKSMAIDTTDPYFEYKLPIGRYEWVEQESRSGTRQKHQDQMSMSGIKKTIMSVNAAAGTVIVQYSKPGYGYVMGMGSRVGNILSAINSLHDNSSALVMGVMRGQKEEINDKSSTVVLAAMLHLSSKSDKDLDDIGIHPSYSDKIFQCDLLNTQAAWLPEFYRGSLTKLGAFYDLLVADGKVDGMDAEGRVKKLEEVISDKHNLPPEKAKQVKQIARMIIRLDEQIEYGYGENISKLPSDPFSTTSVVTEATVE